MDVRIFSPQVRRSVFRFASIAAIPAGSTITSAIWTCDVTAFTALSGGANTLSVHVTAPGVGPPANTPWIEAEVCWSNRTNDPIAWDAAGGDYLATLGKTANLVWPSADGVATFDIAPTIQYILDNHPTRVEWEIKGETESGSRDGFLRIKDATTGTRSSLLITYTLPAGLGGRFAIVLDDDD